MSELDVRSFAQRIQQLDEENAALREENERLKEERDRAKAAWDSSFNQAMANGATVMDLRAQVAALEDERKPDGYLHGWPRNEGTVLIGVGVHCAGCGKDFGITNVSFSDDYVAPTEKPSWPWPEADCPFCNAEERWRKKMAIDPLAERLRAKLKEKT